MFWLLWLIFPIRCIGENIKGWVAKVHVCAKSILKRVCGVRVPLFGRVMCDVLLFDFLSHPSSHMMLLQKNIINYKRFVCEVRPS